MKNMMKKILNLYGLECSIESGFFFFLFIPNFSKKKSFKPMVINYKEKSLKSFSF
jgi:hypothetical protein